MRASPEDRRPAFRHLRIYAYDPMVSRAGEHQVTVRIRNEHLYRRGEEKAEAVSFYGERLEVVDVDASRGEPVWLKPVDLDDVSIAMQHGLEPSESDPQFHQQMVYAVAMRTLEQFDRALGRFVHFSGRRRLRLVPHAFQGSNAFYVPKMRAVLFGYFKASTEAPGENLPGQVIFTCLSHDIVAHEVTHAVVDRLRPYFNVATNPQVRAFHEAFADTVALFQRLTMSELVQRALQDGKGRVRKSQLLANIAAQFGQGMGSGRALRSALGSTTRVQDVKQEHDLGAVLVSALFDGFSTTYERRTADLLRMGARGARANGDDALHPDLVARLTAECVRTAQSMLTMCIRAFEYLPPADVTFGAFLRALVTADWELNPLDEAGLRASIIEACRRRGIYAMEAGSLAVGALLLPAPPRETWKEHEDSFREWIDVAVLVEVQAQREREVVHEELDPESAPTPSKGAVREGWEGAEDEPLDAGKQLRERIVKWFENLRPHFRELLGMHPQPELERRVHFHSTHRTTSDGAQRFGLVVQLVEIQRVRVGGEWREVPSGATLVIDVTGRLRYVVRSKPPTERTEELEAAARLGMTTPLGWPMEDPSADPLAVDFQGMHEERL